jgi:hypothetical protein
MGLEELLKQRRELFEKNSLVRRRNEKCLTFSELEALAAREQEDALDSCERCRSLYQRLVAAIAEALVNQARASAANPDPSPSRIRM